MTTSEWVGIFSVEDKPVPLPVRATSGAAAFDLTANERATIRFGMVTIVGTGIGWEPDNRERLGLVLPRSGLAVTHGITVVNAPGLIDSDYRGEIKVILTRLMPGEWHVNPGDRIAQLLILDAAPAQLVIRDRHAVSNTERAAGGFGSTGK